MRESTIRTSDKYITSVLRVKVRVRVTEGPHLPYKLSEQKLFVLREYTHGHDQYITSIQVNSSTAKTHVQGTAGETQQDGNDDPLQFSVSFSYSILRPTTSAGHFIPVPDP